MIKKLRDRLEIVSDTFEPYTINEKTSLFTQYAMEHVIRFREEGLVKKIENRVGAHSFGSFVWVVTRQRYRWILIRNSIIENIEARIKKVQ